jgi:hypothetical protein
MKIFTILACLLISFSSVLPQSDTTQSADEYLNSVTDNEEFSEDNDLITDRLEDLKNNPIQLNKCTVEQILEIPFIDRTIAKGIINYRKVNGEFLSVNEILNIETIPRNIALSILPFFVADNSVTTNPLNEKTLNKNTPHLQMRSRIIAEPSDRKGFSENKFIGSRYKIYNRSEINFDKYKFGVLTEKDAGENSVVDFYSLFFQAKELWIFRQIILGDYFVEFGHGLAIWNPYTISKTGSALNIPSMGSNYILPYKSADENKFMRGGAFTIGKNNFNVTGFFSSNKIDGRIDSLNGSINLIWDGYHRTENELAARNQIDILTFGGISNFNLSENFAFRFLIMNYKLQDAKNNYARDEGKTIYSCSYESDFETFDFSGESAVISNKVKTINNLLLKISTNITTVFSYRSYSGGTKSYYGNGFGESSVRENETGFYTGIRIHNHFGLFNFYFDKFKLTNQNEYPFPLSGNEFLFNYQKQFTKNVSLSARYFLENKETAETGDQLSQSSNKRTNRIRLETEFKPVKYVSDKVRIEFSKVKYEKSGKKFNGMLLFNDINLRLFNNRLFAAFRLTIFNTNGYESRIYAFENDLAGVLSNPSFFDEGYKYYLLVKYEIIRNLFLSCKLSELYKPDAESIGSGLNEIRGNREKRFNLQVDYNL